MISELKSLRVVVLISFLFAFSGVAETSEIKSKIFSIPQKDRDQIEWFLSYLVRRENLGFVVFGDTKPGCVAAIPLTHKKAMLPMKLDSPLRYQRNLRQSWDKWRYHRHRFKCPNFIFCEEFNQINGGMYLLLFILSKERLKVILEKYRSEFIEVLGDNFSPDVFLSKLERKKRLRPLLKGDHKLLGLVLGFDLDSCTAFRDRFEGKEVANPMKMVHSKIKGSSIIPVSFAGDPEAKETRLLIDAYRKETPLIEDILNSNDFLVKTIERLKREDSKCSL